MINVLIIDDEVNIREILANILHMKCPDINIVGFAEDVSSGILAVEKHKPDLILLDIKLPDGTGFDLLSKVRADVYNFHVIFITAFAEYALKAFKFSAIDYILKPINTEDLLNAIEKCKTLLKGEFRQKLEAYAYNQNKQDKNRKLILKTQDSIYITEIRDIIRCHADGNYTTFYTTDGNTIMVSQQLGEYEEMLGDFNFFRVHQSHLINLEHVKKFEKKDGGAVIMKDNSSVPVSQRRKEFFLKVINGL